MNRFIQRCFSALTITAVGTMLSAGVVSAGSQPGDQGRPHKDRPEAQVHQQAKNSNDTAQDSVADAHSRQVNKNLPFSLLSIGDLKGHKDHKDPKDHEDYQDYKDPKGHKDPKGGVDQSNTAHNLAVSGNDNVTFQGIEQVAEQKVDGKHGDASGDIDQDAKNKNSTQQSSAAHASSEQKNKNAPVSVLSLGSNNGDVDQSNKAHDVALSNNGNYTDQSIFQAADQKVDGKDGHPGKDDHKSKDGHPSKDQYPGKDDHKSKDGHPSKDGGSSDIDQDAKNKNSTQQSSAAQASSEQKNINLPVSILSVGSNNGDVDQSNKANNKAKSGNDNATGQVIEQAAEQDVDGSGKHGGKDDHKSKDGHPDQGDGTGGDIDQDATNHNDTAQDSSAEASSKQTNVNLPMSILSVGFQQR